MRLCRYNYGRFDGTGCIELTTNMTESDNRRRAGQRVWRLRKMHQWVDAELYVDGTIVDLKLFLNGELAYERRWPTREDALAEAAGKRAELERQGWMAHW